MNSRLMLSTLLAGSAAIAAHDAAAWPTAPGTYKFEDYVSTSATSNPHWIVRTRAHGVELAERKGMCCVIR